MALTPVDINQFDSTWGTAKNDYVNLTLQLKNYNEINNTNLHIRKIQNNELENLNTMGARVKSSSLKTKQEYLLTEYGTQLYRLRCNLMIFTLLVVSAVLALCALFSAGKGISKDVLLGVVIGVLVVWALAVFIVIKVNSNRRKYAWSQFYWKDMPRTTTP